MKKDSNVNILCDECDFRAVVTARGYLYCAGHAIVTVVSASNACRLDKYDFKAVSDLTPDELKRLEDENRS